MMKCPFQNGRNLLKSQQFESMSKRIRQVNTRQSSFVTEVANSEREVKAFVISKHREPGK